VPVGWSKSAKAVSTRLVLARMPGQVPLMGEAPFHWPPSSRAASNSTGSKPWRASQAPAASPAGPAPMTATARGAMPMGSSLFMLRPSSCRDIGPES
jgi:hypothetical protein